MLCSCCAHVWHMPPEALQASSVCLWGIERSSLSGPWPMCIPCQPKTPCLAMLALITLPGHASPKHPAKPCQPRTPCQAMPGRPSFAPTVPVPACSNMRAHTLLPCRAPRRWPTTPQRMRCSSPATWTAASSSCILCPRRRRAATPHRYMGWACMCTCVCVFQARSRVVWMCVLVLVLPCMLSHALRTCTHTHARAQA